MKNIGSKISNRTKVIGGMTILLGIGTIISAVRDSKEVAAIENDEMLLVEAGSDAIEQIAEGIEEISNEIA